MTRQLLATCKVNLLHEALGRAVKVAPTKGAGFDKASGLMFDIKPNEIWIRATDLERTFFGKIAADVTTEMTFRITTAVSKFVSSLPMAADQDVRFHYDDTKQRVEVQFAKSPTKIQVPLVSGEFPRIEWFDYASMDDAFELASRLSAVTWAIEDSAVAPLIGVRIDGEWIEALCSKQMARIKCAVSTTEPIVAVVKNLAPLIAMGSRVRIKAGDGRVIVALDEHTQVTSATVLGQWPNLAERLEKLEMPHGFKINRQRLLDALARILSFTAGDRFPRINFAIGKDRVTVSLLEAKDGEIFDVITLNDKTGDDECTFVFNPAWLQKAIDTFPGAEIEVKYLDPRRPIRLLEPMTSYNALIVGLQPGEKVESPKEEDK